MFWKEAFHAVRPIIWEPGDACKKYWDDGRLVGAHAWPADGSRPIRIYSLYGIAGARWERTKRAYVVAMLRAVVADSVARGEVPSLIGGDFNLQRGNAPELDHFLRDEE